MIPDFKNLSAEESELMVNVPALVAILIAGADNNIDKKEKKWAIKLTKYRKFSSNPVLHDYYDEVNKNFEEKLNEFISSFPSEHFERNQIIASELEKLNTIFTKLNKDFAEKFYESLLSFAKHIAESSGGILRISTISESEKEWIKLKMILPPYSA